MVKLNLTAANICLIERAVGSLLSIRLLLRIACIDT